jgi:hypothetical protein
MGDNGNSVGPREWTESEVRTMFLNRCWHLIDYWNNLPDNLDQRYRIVGTVFSLLTMLDGGQMGICGFKVIPDPHPDDKEYLRGEGENWYPSDCNIAGYLHELMHRMDPNIGVEIIIPSDDSSDVPDRE